MRYPKNFSKYRFWWEGGSEGEGKRRRKICVYLSACVCRHTKARFSFGLIYSELYLCKNILALFFLLLILPPTISLACFHFLTSYAPSSLQPYPPPTASSSLSFVCAFTLKRGTFQTKNTIQWNERRREGGEKWWTMSNVNSSD